ncbi:MAG: hypothetical protein AAGF07_02785 [Patescibacteria group bacterium]
MKDNFDSISEEFNISETYYFWEFREEENQEIDYDLIFCDEFWYEIYATKVVDEYIESGLSFEEMVWRVDPPPGLSSNKWIDLLEEIYNYS